MGIAIVPASAPQGIVGAESGRSLVAEPGTTPVNGTAAANTAVTVTITGLAAQTIRLTSLSSSYSAAPTAGRLQVQDGATTIHDLDIIAGGPTTVPLPPGGLKITAGNNCVITLAAAGAAVIGKVNASSYFGA